MPRHDACSKGKGGQGLDPHRVWGVFLSARRPPVGGCGSSPWWRRPSERWSGGQGWWGDVEHVGGGGAEGWWVGACVRGRG